MSVRDDPVLFLEQGKGKTVGGSSVGGGSAITTTHVHRLNGPEHTLATDDDRLNATGGEPGLLPKLSGIVTDVLRGDGTWGAGGSGVTVEDEGTPLATDATTLNFVGAGVAATGVGATKTVTVSEPDADAHIADATDAHDASAISVVTSGFAHSTDDDVQGVLADLDAAIGSGGSVFFNVEDYGAVGDNSTDDTTAVQAALDAAQTAGGGRVYFPRKYKVTATLTIHTTGVVIFGDGGPDETSMVRMATSNTDLFDINNNGTLTQFEDIYLEGPNTGTGRGIVTTKEIVARALRVRRFYKGVVLGSGSFYASIAQSFIGENLQTQIETAAGCNNFKITDTYIYGGAYGIDVGGAENFKISGGSVEAQTTAGIRVNGGSSNGQGGLIDSIYFENGSGVSDILIGDSSQVQSVAVVNCAHVKSAHSATSGWSVRGSNVAGLTVIGGYTDSTQAILVDGSSSAVVIMNLYRTNTGTVTLPSGSINLSTAGPTPSITYGTAAAGTSGGFLRSDAVIAKPTEADLSLSDVTTLNVSTSKHGFAPKIPNDSSVYLDGTGAYSTPAGTSSSSGGVVDHVHVVGEAHTSDGSTTAFLLDNEFDEGSVAAYNLTSGLRLAVTETLPRTATVSAAGTAGNAIVFDYIPVTA